MTSSNSSVQLRAVLERYRDESVIFVSAVHNARYCVQALDDSGVVISRLDAKESEQLTFSHFEQLCKRVTQSGGSFPLRDLNSPVAATVAALQAPFFALSADRKSIIDVSSQDRALEVFCDWLGRFRVAFGEGGPKLYKPMTIHTVVTGIGTGELRGNKIPFDWIVPRFMKGLADLDITAGESEAAHGFYHLTSELFWMHAVNDLQNPMRDGSEGPRAAREKVKYALIKDTFWNLLQNAEAREKVLETLAQSWFESRGPVRREVQFWWVNQGTTYEQARQHGTMWAPKKNESGQSFFHWANLAKVLPSDVVFNYSEGSIRAVSVVKSKPYDSAPNDFESHWSGEGWRADLEYSELSHPVPIAAIGQSLVKIDLSHGPINRSAAVNQGYLFELTREAASIIAEHIDIDRLPHNLQNPLGTLKAQHKERATLDYQILEMASEAVRNAGLVYPKGILDNFILSCLTKPFVILTGNSGTGKTQLAVKFARWLAGEDNYRLVPVGADWTDNRNVLGYYNPFEKTYQLTPILSLVLRAQQNSDLPFFLILDEMNLSHVERYLADFLSGMESGEKLPLHAQGAEVKASNGMNVPQTVILPHNLFVVGTVNIDETTYMFSPKVLDRANVLEFRVSEDALDNSFGTFLRNASGGLKELNSRASREIQTRFLDFSLHHRGIRLIPGFDHQVELQAAAEVLEKLFRLLAKREMEFGYRTATEVIRYLRVANQLSRPDAWNWEPYLDVQILQKVLPKLHGTRRRIHSVLLALASFMSNADESEAAKFLAIGEGFARERFDLSRSKNARFPHSYQKLVRMIETVERDQFVSFIQ